MNRPLALKLSGPEEIVLRSAVASDADRLRQWKNEQREFFFFNGEISEAMQGQWMKAYFERPDDYMFMVERAGQTVGCLGLRFEKGRGDIYNVILGDPSLRGKGVMSLALRAVLSFGRKLSEGIGLKILTVNPAVGFYAKNGLVKVSEHDNYYEMRVDWEQFQPVDIE